MYLRSQKIGDRGIAEGSSSLIGNRIRHYQERKVKVGNSGLYGEPWEHRRPIKMDDVMGIAGKKERD